MIESRTTSSTKLTPQLQDLSLKIRNITDLTLCSVLARHSLTSLKLDFWHCGQKPDVDALYNVFSRTLHLRRLSVSANFSFFDGDFPRTLQQATSHLELEELSLCTRERSIQLPFIVREIGLTLPVTRLDVARNDAVWPIEAEAGFKEGLFASLTLLQIWTGLESCPCASRESRD